MAGWTNSTGCGGSGSSGGGGGRGSGGRDFSPPVRLRNSIFDTIHGGNSGGGGRGSGSSGGGGGRGSGGRDFSPPIRLHNSIFDTIHGANSGGGGRGSGRWRGGGRSRGRPPPQPPHHRYRRVDAVRGASPPASLSEQQAASSTSNRHRYQNRFISATDKSSASGTAGSTDTREPDDKASRSAANFECNVCFDMATEPVVTKCGHLFCWECLYQWLHVHSHHRECPVCKGQVADDAVIPIYGRGGSAASVDNAPPRPTGARVESSRRRQQQQRPPTPPELLSYRRQPGLSEFFELVENVLQRHRARVESSRQQELPTIPNPTVLDADEEFDPLYSIPPDTQDIDMEDYDSTTYSDVEYEYDYNLGVRWFNQNSSQAHDGMINTRDNIVSTATGVHHQQDFGYTGTRPRNSRGRRGRHNRARASANHSSTDEMVMGDTSHSYLQNGGRSNSSAGGAFGPNGGWTERRGRSNLNSNSGGGRGGMQGSRRQRTNYNW